MSPPAHGVEVAPLAGLEGERADDGFLSGVGAAPVACPAFSGESVRVVGKVVVIVGLPSCVAQFLSGSSHRKSMSPLLAEMTRSNQPMGAAVEWLPKYFWTRGDSRPWRRRWDLACWASWTVSSRARESWWWRVVLQEEWMGKGEGAEGVGCCRWRMGVAWVAP